MTEHQYEFEIGDRVIAIDTIDDLDMGGMVCNIVCIDVHTSLKWGIEFDDEFDEGHDCDGYGTDGRCRYARDGEIQLLSDDKWVDTESECLSKYLAGYQKV